nr:MAG TPA: hypothetical protein [Caudoviricetes sp.]
MTTQEPITYKRRTVHYKRAVIGGSKQYLQSILEDDYTRTYNIQKKNCSL